MIEFKDIRIEDKERYELALSKSEKRGCEMSFANLFLWGKQEIAHVGDIVALRGTFSSTIYPFPLGEGDKSSVIAEIIQDAKEKNIPLIITSIYGKEGLSMIQDEIDELKESIQGIATNTEYNTMKLLDGSNMPLFITSV